MARSRRPRNPSRPGPPPAPAAETQSPNSNQAPPAPAPARPAAASPPPPSPVRSAAASPPPPAPARAPAPPPPAPPATPEPPRHFLYNLGSILLFAVALGAWLIAFTDAFAVAGLPLALAALFLWLLLFTRALPEERVRQLRRGLAERVLERPRLWVYVTGALVTLILISSFLGPLELRALPGDGRMVRVYRAGGEDPGIAGYRPLPADGRDRMLRWVGWGGSAFRVKAEGLPEQEVTLYPWWINWEPRTVVVPSSLLRPVVLIGPASPGMVPESGPPAELVVRIYGPRSPSEGKKSPEDAAAEESSEPVRVIREPYRGGLVWLGTRDADIPLPDELPYLEGWSRSYINPRVYGRPPAVLDPPPGEEPVRLEPGQRVVAEVVRDERVIAQGDRPLIVRAPAGADFIQLLLLRPLR